MASRRALWGLVAGSTLLRLAWAACLGPGNDEAYHYLFVVHPDWSYYDHPPMTALVERLGLALAGGRVSAFALRLGFVGLFAGSTWLMARLGSRFFGPRAGVLAALLLNASAYFGAAASTFALPDGPLVFFWLLTLDRLAAAVASPGGLRPWAWVGLAWGGALLSKYQAVFLPVGAILFLAIEPTARHWLRRPGPYLALAIGLAAFSPVVAWNAAHGWASFAFQGGRASAESGFRPDALGWFVLGQALYLLPWVWASLVVALVRVLRRLRRAATPAERFLVAQALPPLAAFLAVACSRVVLSHWSLVGFLAIMPMAGRDWAGLWESDPVRSRRRLALLAAVPVLGMSLVAAQARWGLFQREGQALVRLLGPEHDPTVDTYGWDQVAREIERRGLVGRPGTFLFTSKWYHSGHLAFAVANRAPVLCYNPRGAHGFAHWSEPGEWVGQDGILIVVNRTSTEPDMYDRWFERIEPLGVFDVVRAGGAVRRVKLYRCVRQTRPFPFHGVLSESDRAQLVADRGFGGGRRLR